MQQGRKWYGKWILYTILETNLISKDEMYWINGFNWIHHETLSETLTYDLQLFSLNSSIYFSVVINATLQHNNKLLELGISCLLIRLLFSYFFFISEMNLVCPNCFKRYSKLNSLQCHLRRDCGTERKYGCKLCPMRFKRKHTLKDHVSRRHPHDFQNFLLEFTD